MSNLFQILQVGWTADDPDSPSKILESSDPKINFGVANTPEMVQSSLLQKWDAVIFPCGHGRPSESEITDLIRNSHIAIPLILVAAIDRDHIVADDISDVPIHRITARDLSGAVRSIITNVRWSNPLHFQIDDKESSVLWEKACCLAVEGSSDAIILIQDDRIQFANQRTAESLEYSIEELKSRAVSEFIYPEDRESFRDRYIQVQEGIIDHNRTLVARVLRKISGLEWSSFNCSPISWHDRPAVIIFMRSALHRGINEYCQKLCSEDFAQFMNHLPAGANIKDASGNLLFINEYARQSVGPPAHEIAGRKYSEAYQIAEETTREIDKLEQMVRETGAPFHGIVEYKYGEQCRFYMTVKFLLPDGKGARNVGSILVDVTDQVKAERALRETEKRYHALYENLTDALTVLDPIRDDKGEIIDFIIVDSNPASARPSGKYPEDFIGTRISQSFPGFNKSEKFKQYAEVAQSGVTRRIIQMSYSGKVKLDSTIFAIGEGTVAVLSKDITLVSKAEDDLRKALAYARSLIEASLDPLVTISEDGKITDVNRATELATGVGRNELIGKDFSDCFTEPEKAKSGYEKVLKDGIVTDYPLTIKHRSGRTMDVVYNASQYRDESGRVQGVFAAARDVTGLRKAETQAVRLTRVYAVLTGINEAILRIHDLDQLYHEACRIAVQEGGMPMAWIGLIDETTSLVKVAAVAGKNDGYLDNIKISARDVSIGRGPTGTCLREGRYNICPDFESDPRMEPWRIEALKRGYRSSIAFPLKKHGKVVGALTMYSGEPGFFNDEEVRLLLALADDLSFAIGHLNEEQRLKLAEVQIRQDAEQYNTILKIAQEGFWRFDASANILEVNDAYCRMSGYSREELLSMRVPDLDAVESDQDVSQHIQKVMSSGFDRFESRHRRKDGSIFDVEISSSYWAEAGQFLLFIHDISNRKKAERDMIESERLLEEAQQIGQMGNWEYDLITGGVRWSKEMFRIFGRDPEFGPPTFEESFSYMTEEVGKGVRNAFQKAIQENRLISLDGRIFPTDGRLCYGDLSVIPIHDGGDAVVKIRGTVRDITERKIAEDALRLSEERLKHAQDIGGTGDFELDLATGKVYWSESVYKMVNRDPKLGPPTMDEIRAMHTDDSLRKWNETLDSVIRTGERAEFDREFVLPSGKSLFNHTVYVPMKDENGKIVGVRGTIIDITRLKLGELELEHTLEQLRKERRTLEEKNIALREVMTQIEAEKDIIKKRFTTNIEQAVLPTLVRLSEKAKDPQKRELEVVIKEVNEIVSPFIDTLRNRFANLSPREVEICRMIKGGLTSKEIAENLNIADKTVQKYRELIRKKLNITNENTNLRTFLDSMPM